MKQAGEVAGAIHGWQAVVALKRGQAPTGGGEKSLATAHEALSLQWVAGLELVESMEVDEVFYAALGAAESIIGGELS